jgi:hypothetical protein
MSWFPELLNYLCLVRGNRVLEWSEPSCREQNRQAGRRLPSIRSARQTTPSALSWLFSLVELQEQEESSLFLEHHLLLRKKNGIWRELHLQTNFMYTNLNSFTWKKYEDFLSILRIIRWCIIYINCIKSTIDNNVICSHLYFSIQMIHLRIFVEFGT